MKQPAARRIGPPRSNSQYHSPNAMTLVAQMDAPEANSGPAVPPALPSRIARISSMAETPLAIVTSKMSTMPAIRIAVPPRSTRTGSAMLSPISSAPSRLGSSHRGSGSVRCGGSRSCKTIAAITLAVIGQRRSPRVGRSHAGAPRPATRPAPACSALRTQACHGSGPLRRRGEGERGEAGCPAGSPGPAGSPVPAGSPGLAGSCGGSESVICFPACPDGRRTSPAPGGRQRYPSGGTAASMRCGPGSASACPQLRWRARPLSSPGWPGRPCRSRAR